MKHAAFRSAGFSGSGARTPGCQRRRTGWSAGVPPRRGRAVRRASSPDRAFAGTAGSTVRHDDADHAIVLWSPSCWTKARSPFVRGGTPNSNRPYGSCCASSWPQSFRLNGGLAIAVEQHQPAIAHELRRAQVSPWWTSGSLRPCSSRFILQMAHVLSSSPVRTD